MCVGRGYKNLYFIFFFLDEIFIYYILNILAAALQSHSRFEALLRADLFSQVERCPWVELKALFKTEVEREERTFASTGLPSPLNPLPFESRLF